jgi:Coenzyme PQQ synthesis protein D (PqqD)
VYRLSNGVRSAHSKDGATVLDISQGRVFRLNPAASRIIELLKNECPPSEIAARIGCEFGASREIAEADVGEFLRSLSELNLVEEVPLSHVPGKE